MKFGGLSSKIEGRKYLLVIGLRFKSKIEYKNENLPQIFQSFLCIFKDTMSILQAKLRDRFLKFPPKVPKC